MFISNIVRYHGKSKLFWMKRKAYPKWKGGHMDNTLYELIPIWWHVLEGMGDNHFLRHNINFHRSISH